MIDDKSSGVAQDFFQKCFRGDISAAVELLDPKVSYRVPGSGRLAGTYEGPQAVSEHVQTLLALTDSRVNVLKWEDWMVGVNHLAGLVEFGVQRGAALNHVRAVLLIEMSNENTIRRIEVFFSNQANVDRFFA